MTIKKVFANSSAFFNWLVVSSVDPASVALTVQGFFSMTIVQTLFGALPYIGIHPTFTLAILSAGIVSAIYTIATIVTSVVTLYALFRKAIVSIHNLVPAPVKVVPVVKTVVSTVSAPIAVPTPSNTPVPPTPVTPTVQQ
jgi:hypothetical protein